ncbi:MAG: mcmE [Ignavibacteria bacterium]|nr:mcmE [Ignavibacteria bacterium]
MVKSINHIGIAVRNLDESIELFGKIFDFEDVHRETVAEQKVEIASFKVGDVALELTCATDPSSPIAKFIEKRGEGIHHIAFNTDDAVEELSTLKSKGINLIDETLKEGAHNMLIAFLHPKSTAGILMEICQKK